MDDGDRLARQLGVRVEILERWIIPLGDLAQEDFSERRTVNNKFTGFDTFEVHDRHYAAHDHRKLGKTALVELFAGKGSVSSTEDHGLGFDLLDAAAGANRLIVQAYVRLFLVGVGPLCVDRIRKCCASS